ncbi:transmembrane protein 248-like [Neocloeon triangulifer]|uniref:transmembrane protein 248-like n=1 Tax=Neocloeon triangulifer TaxID=2078957 RepID=UPI00286F4952|nr:transmembrane protein 248-like [Neocloeon triangulifer]
MSATSCCSNLKGFAMTRPPLVVFTCCLLALSFATIYLSHCIDDSNFLPNPDIPRDWNVLLTRMAGLDLCARPAAAKSSEIKNESANLARKEDIVSVTAALELSKELHSQMGNDTEIGGNINATLLGIKGVHNIHVSFVVFSNYTNGVHHNHKICATFTGLKSELPETQAPTQCDAKKGSTPGEKFSALSVRLRGPEAASDWCSEGTELRMAYKINSNLTATLTVADKALINLHLMHTSYFLLVMALTLIFYAMIKGSHSHNHEKLPLGP